MAEKTKTLEREYTIPLRKNWLKAPEYERMRIAIRTIKRFIAKHMKIPDRELSNVKLDVLFNNNLWFRGRRHPPSKVKVKATKEGDIVKVNFAETPEYVKFLKAKIEKRHKKAEKPVEPKKEEKKEEAKPVTESKEEKKEDEEKKKDEKEKGQAVAEQRTMHAQQDAKVQKHLTAKKEPSFHRMALKK